MPCCEHEGADHRWMEPFNCLVDGCDCKRLSEDPVPCPVKTCIVEGLNGEGELQTHLDTEHTLEERRQLVVDQILTDEKNFVEGTISHQCFQFFKWVQSNTDIFDPVMITMMADDWNAYQKEGKADPDYFRLDDDTIKDLVKGYLLGETNEQFYNRPTKAQTMAKISADEALGWINEIVTLYMNNPANKA